MKRLLLLPWGLCLFAAGSAAQSVLVSYTFTNQSTTTTALTSSVLADNITASLFSVSDGTFTSTNFTTAAPPSSPAVADTGSWDSLTPAKYFAFTLTPLDGTQLNITGISFDYRQTTAGAANFQVDIGASANVTAGTFIRDNAWHSVAPTFTSVAATGATEFRIYGYNGGGGSFAIDQVTVWGTMTAIPEPSTYAAMAGAATLGCAWMLRRQQRRRPGAAGATPGPPPG